MDIHTQTAAEIFGIPEDQVTPEQRVAAREINFGITYEVSNREGMTHKALRAELQLAGFRAMYGGYSGLSALKAAYFGASRRLLAETADDLYTDLAQLERRLLARQWEWAEARHPIRRSPPTVLAALAGFDTPEEV